MFIWLVDLFKHHVDIPRTHLAEKKDHAKVHKLRSVLACLPETNIALAQYICEFLYHITTFSAKNKMDANNLAVVFAPIFLQPRGDHVEKAISDSMQNCAITKFMIERQEKIFRVRAMKICGEYDDQNEH